MRYWKAFQSLEASVAIEFWRCVRRLSAIDLGMPSRPPTDAKDVVAAIYRGVGDRTIRRDLNLLLEHELIIERDGLPAANVSIMDEFSPG